MIFKFLIFPVNFKKRERVKSAIEEREELQDQEFELLRKHNGKADPDGPDSVSVAEEVS